MEFLSSPNFNERAPGTGIRHLILHYTGMKTAAEAIDRLRDPAAEVSAHYVVDTDGRTIQLVEEQHRAWHAGVSFWQGEADINSTSIGIEIVNPGHEYGYAPFPPEQIAAVIDLCSSILARYPGILPQYVLAHSDIAPTRKMDPGELFPWAELAAEGVGLFPIVDEQTSRRADEIDLKIYGYDISNLPAAITAFQRHFRQHDVNGRWDDECGEILAELLAVIQRG